MEEKEIKMLKKNYKTTAIVIEIHQPEVIHDSYSGTFQYKIKNKIYKFTQIGNYTLLKLGDTVLIEYAVKDNSIARVIDKNYMRKFKK